MCAQPGSLYQGSEVSPCLDPDNMRITWLSVSRVFPPLSPLLDPTPSINPSPSSLLSRINVISSRLYNKGQASLQLRQIENVRVLSCDQRWEQYLHVDPSVIFFIVYKKTMKLERITEFRTSVSSYVVMAMGPANPKPTVTRPDNTNTAEKLHWLIVMDYICLTCVI